MSSSPLSSATSELEPDLEAQLDAEIVQIQREIAKLRSQKQRLSSALLGSNRVQKQILKRKNTARPNDRNSVDDGSTTDENAIEEKLRELDQAINEENKDNDAKIHALGFGVTSFPVEDVAAATRTDAGEVVHKHLLGVKFDLHPTTKELLQSWRRSDTVGQKRLRPQYDVEFETREGEGEDKPTFILLLRKVTYNTLTYLKVHQHNVPNHIDVAGYTQRFLPLPAALEDAEHLSNLNAENGDTREDSFQDDSGIDLTQDIQPHTTENAVTGTPAHNGTIIPTNQTHPKPVIKGNGQDLHALIAHVRDDLRAWHYRVMSIKSAQLALDLPISLEPVHDSNRTKSTEKQGKFGVERLEMYRHDAREIRITWRNGALGHLRIAYDGTIKRVVVFVRTDRARDDLSDDDVASDTDLDKGGEEFSKASRGRDLVRLHDVERTISRNHGEHVSVTELPTRLELAQSKFS